jgi:hypothetical protein
MPNLKLISLQCHKPDDISEADEAGFDMGVEDEPYLMAGHKKVWNGRMKKGDIEDLAGVNPISFKESIRVELWEKDPNYVSDKDDQLGNITVYASQMGAGEISNLFKRRKARYTLTFKVE